MIIDYILQLLRLRRIPVGSGGYIVIPHYRFAPNLKGQFKYGRTHTSFILKLISTARI